LTSVEGLKIWLGSTKNFGFKKGVTFKTEEGTKGEIRTLKIEERIRLVWQPEGETRPSTLQITLFCPRNTSDKTNLLFHQENLPDAKLGKRCGSIGKRSSIG